LTEILKEPALLWSMTVLLPVRWSRSSAGSIPPLPRGASQEGPEAHFGDKPGLILSGKGARPSVT